MLRLVATRLAVYGLFGWILMFGFLGAREGFSKDAALGAVPAGAACGIVVAIMAAIRLRRDGPRS